MKNNRTDREVYTALRWSNDRGLSDFLESCSRAGKGQAEASASPFWEWKHWLDNAKWILNALMIPEIQPIASRSPSEDDIAEHPGAERWVLFGRPQEQNAGREDGAEDQPAASQAFAAMPEDDRDGMASFRRLTHRPGEQPLTPGAALRRLREDSGRNMGDLADFLGTVPAAISAIETECVAPLGGADQPRKTVQTMDGPATVPIRWQYWQPTGG